MIVTCRTAFFFLSLVVALTASLNGPPALAADETRWQAAFRELDSNGDGRVTREEFEINKVRVIFSRSQDRNAVLTFPESLLSRSAFDSLDLDKDGILSARDIAEAPFFRFANFDTNTDGYIDFGEFSALLRSIIER